MYKKFIGWLFDRNVLPYWCVLLADCGIVLFSAVLCIAIDRGANVDLFSVGFAAGEEWVIKACNKLQGQYTSGPCSVSQMAAAAAFAGPQECVETMRRAFERRKNLIVSLAREIPGLEVNDPADIFL